MPGTLADVSAQPLDAEATNTASDKAAEDARLVAQTVLAPRTVVWAEPTSARPLERDCQRP